MEATKQKDFKRLQTKVWGGLKEKVLAHLEETQLSEADLVKLALSEYYSKINTSYNK